MILLAPLFLYLGLGLAAAAIGSHFIVTRQPTSSILPTVRFVPLSTVRITTLAAPEDRGLLLLRVLLATCLGLAFARPLLLPERTPVVRIVLADVSRAVRRIEDVRDSAAALLRRGDVLIAFDSSARVIDAGAESAARGLERSPAEARFSTGLIAALRTASRLRHRADSVELIMVSPFRATAVDGATSSVRALWPGRIRLVTVAAGPDSLAPRSTLAISAAPDDGVALAATLAGLLSSNASVRLVRGARTPADSLWAAAEKRTLVRWPVEGAPPGWIARTAPDTMGAVTSGDLALVYPLERRWQPDSVSGTHRVAARWVDGAPAASERLVGQGCIRDVAIPVPVAGDLVLRPAFGALLRRLTAPCGALTDGAGVDSAQRIMLTGVGGLASGMRLPAPASVFPPLVPWLLLTAIVLALLELRLRRRLLPDWSDAGPAPADPSP